MTERANLQTRTLTFEIDGERAADAGIPVVVSSDAVVEVSDGPEVLVHTPDAVDLQRAPLPIIATHRSNQINVGIVKDLQITNGQLRGMAHFGTRQEAVEYRNDVTGGIIRSVSAGYARMQGYIRKDGVLVTTRWMPTHAAMIAEPADVNAGFYRAKPGLELVEPPSDPPDTPNNESEAPEGAFFTPAEPAQAADQTTEVVTTPAAPAAVRSIAMSDVQAPAAGASAADHTPGLNAVEVERERREAVINLCKANKLDSRIQQNWIERGLGFSEVSKEFLDLMAERNKNTPTVASDIGMTQNETQRYSLFRAIRALRYGNQNAQLLRDAAFEFDCSRTLAKQLGRAESGSILVPGEVLMRPVGKEAAARALSVVPGTKGGFTVGIDQMGFIDILRNRSVVMRMGATVLSGLQGNVAFPRQTSSPSVTWQAGENVSVTPADQALGQLSMTPKTCIARTDISEQLLAQTGGAAEQFVMSDLAKNVAIAGVDNAAINGTGGAQPLGIKNTTGIASSQDAASATYAKILAFVSTAGAANAILGNPGFATTTAGAARLMQVQRFTSTDTPLWTGNMLDGQLVGFNAMSSEQFASGNIVFGSWETLLIGEWGVLELAMDNGGTRFDSYTVGIRAVWMVDILLRYPQAWVFGTNLS